LCTPHGSEMAAAMGEEEKHRRPTEARSSTASFPLRCGHRPRLWLAAVREKRGCLWRAGAMLRMYDG
jgi:hypothetical protein